jgi:hypothetical protein
LAGRFRFEGTRQVRGQSSAPACEGKGTDAESFGWQVAEVKGGALVVEQRAVIYGADEGGLSEKLLRENMNRSVPPAKRR